MKTGMNETFVASRMVAMGVLGWFRKWLVVNKNTNSDKKALRHNRPRKTLTSKRKKEEEEKKDKVKRKKEEEQQQPRWSAFINKRALNNEIKRHSKSIHLHQVVVATEARKSWLEVFRRKFTARPFKDGKERSERRRAHRGENEDKHTDTQSD